MRRVLGIAIALVILLLAPAAARAATATSVVMYSDAGDYIGAGQQRLYTPGSSSIATSGGPNGELYVNVSGGASGDYFTLDFAAPPGQALAPGIYNDAQRAPFRTAGHPGIDIYGSGRGCNETAGRFEVKDIGTASDGSVNRLWIVYEQHCEGGIAALFGEVRINEPVDDAPATPATAIARWPPVDPGGAGSAVPITLPAAGSTKVTTVSVKGDNPGDFPVRLDDCSGKTLAAGAACEVWVRFVPTTPGTRTARLEVADSGGHHYTTALQGFSYGGTTKATMQSDQGDYIGAGKSYSYTPANASMAAGGARSGVSYGIGGADGSDWSATFKPPSGDIVAPGTYDNATRAPFSGDGAGLEVTGNGRGCNEIKGKFTIKEATFDSSGRLRTLDVTFEQHCEGAAPAFRGELDYRAGDNTPLAPWMGGDGQGSSGGSPGDGAPGGTQQQPNSPPGPTTTVTMKPRFTDIAFGRATRLGGSVSVDGKRVPGVTVRLEASAFPYTSFGQVAERKAGSKGGFSFKVKPDRNTRYRVVTDGGASSARTVFVYLAGKARRKALGQGRYRQTFDMLGPLDAPYAGRAVYFYKITDKGHRARRVARERLLGLGHGRFRVSAVLRLRSRRSPILACMHESKPDAWGRPAPIDKACGAPRLFGDVQPRAVIE
jgi:hypothetical protein